MQECWCAFALAIMSPNFILPEDASNALLDGKIEKISRKLGVIAPEIIALKSDGMSWKEISEIFGYNSKEYAMQIVSKWRKKENNYKRIN